MMCAWQEYLCLLPEWMRNDVDELGREMLQELRLRINQVPELIIQGRSFWLHREAVSDDLNFVINAASQYSPWSASTSSSGYITASGGHRVGLCGDAIIQNNTMKGIRNPTSLCLRVARDFPGIAARSNSYSGSILIIGRPGSGKTTLLRDLIRQRSDNGSGSVAVVDERGELFPVSRQKNCFSVGKRTDILTSCPKSTGIEILLRTMGSTCIAVDEITHAKDCEAMLEAGWCGVSLLATAHAASLNDLRRRPVYRPLLSSGLFDAVFIMQEDKSWKAERL